jgi:hypothetical protein
MKIELSDAEDVRVFLEMCGVVPADEVTNFIRDDGDEPDDTLLDGDPCEGCEKVSPRESIERAEVAARNALWTMYAEACPGWAWAFDSDLDAAIESVRRYRRRASEILESRLAEIDSANMAIAALERGNFELRDLCRVISQRTHSDRVVSQMLADKRELWDRDESKTGKEGATMDAGETPATPAGDTQLAGGGPIETQVTHVTMGKFTGELMVSQDGGETWENRGREPIAIVMKRPSDQPYVDLRERLEDTESRLAEALRDCGDLEVSLSNEMARGQTLAQAVRDVMGLNQEPPVYGELSTAWAEYHG